VGFLVRGSKPLFPPAKGLGRCKLPQYAHSFWGHFIAQETRTITEADPRPNFSVTSDWQRFFSTSWWLAPRPSAFLARKMENVKGAIVIEYRTQVLIPFSKALRPAGEYRRTTESQKQSRCSARSTVTFSDTEHRRRVVRGSIFGDPTQPNPSTDCLNPTRRKSKNMDLTQPNPIQLTAKLSAVNGLPL